MENYPTETNEALGNFYTFIKRTIYIKITYLLIAIFINTILFSLPGAIFISIFFMIIYAIIILFLVRRYIIPPKSIINTLFLMASLDILLITIIINFLGIIFYIFYSFYIILGFMSLPRNKSFYLTGWIIILYLSLALLQHFQIFNPIQFFTSEEMNPYNFRFMLAGTIIFLATLLFLSLRCHDFYQLIAIRIDDSQKAQLVLEEEKNSLEIRIQAKKIELKEEKRGLEKKVTEREEELEQESKNLGERAEELAKFQKVAIDRELKTKELEKELARLEKKLKS